MLRVDPERFRTDLPEYTRRALAEPVAIVENGADTLILLSAEEYRRLLRGYRQAFAAADLGPDFLADLERSEIPPEHAYGSDGLCDPA